MLGMSLLNFLGLVALTSLLLATSCEAYSSSRNCQFNRHLRTTNISNCKYGWEVDACGNKVYNIEKMKYSNICFIMFDFCFRFAPKDPENSVAANICATESAARVSCAATVTGVRYNKKLSNEMIHLEQKNIKTFHFILGMLP